MAAPTDAGFGLGVHDGETVELDKGSGLGLSAEDPIGFDDKNGDEEEEEVQVAKKARVEKAENGVPEVTADDVDEEYGVESVEGFTEKEVDDTELDPLLAHNGTGESEERINGEGDDEEDSENGGLGAADDDDDEAADVDAVTGKDAPGDAGLRTLLQEGETTKTSILNGTDLGDATHTLNGAK